jgi:Zn-dependent protease with chaperone function
MNWYQIEQTPPHIANFILALQKDHKFNFKKIGIIEDDNPNAFTYGHFRKNARLVLSRGIFTYLTNEEQQAVVAHEIGHVVHRDFIWMTVASAIPVIAYTFYAGLRFNASAMSRSKSGNKNSGQVAAGMYAVAIGAWLVYFISGYMVLLLSRIREYYADRFAGEVTGKPEDLSSALVKIAYGMIVADANMATEMAEGRASSKAKWQTSFTKGIRSMGIFDVKSAKAMSMTIQGRGKKIDPTAVALAASWDLSHPWAKFMELQSTHPLPAKRLKALDKQVVFMGREPSYPDLGKIKPPESLWDEFLIELFLEMALPFLIFLFPLLTAGVAVYLSNGSVNMFVGAGIGLVFISLLWYYRKTVKYPKLNEKQKIVDVTYPLMDMTKNGYYEASPVRGKAVAVEGIVIGRGTPGYFLSEDFVVQDNTGIVRVDYSPILGFMSWFFALFRVPKLMGQKVTVYGWYHRSPTPNIKVWRVFSEDRHFKNHWAGLNNFIALFLFIIAISLIGYGLTI